MNGNPYFTMGMLFAFGGAIIAIIAGASGYAFSIDAASAIKEENIDQLIDTSHSMNGMIILASIGSMSGIIGLAFILYGIFETDRMEDIKEKRKIAGVVIFCLIGWAVLSLISGIINYQVSENNIDAIEWGSTTEEAADNIRLAGTAALVGGFGGLVGFTGIGVVGKKPEFSP